MESAKKKRVRGVRVVMTNIFMGLSVVAIVAVLTLLAMGYTLGRDGGLEQAGLVQISSRPTGASVEIDGEVVGAKTATSKMLVAGKHRFLISKSGYGTWEREVEVEAGVVTRLNWARLFPLTREVFTVGEYDEIGWMSVAPGAGYILIVTSEMWWVVDVRGDEAKVKSVDVSGVFDGVEGGIEVVRWGRNGDRVAVKYGAEWVSVDLDNVGESLNLTREFGVVISDVLVASDSGEKLWVLVEGGLREVGVRGKTMSDELVSGVSGMVSSGSAVMYLVDGEEGRKIGIYKDGEKGGSEIAKVPSEGVGMAMGSYWGEEYVAYNVGKRLFILKGTYPSYGGRGGLETVVESDLEFVPEALSVSPGGRFVMAVGGGKVVCEDLDEEEMWEYEVGEGRLLWFDDYMVWSDWGGKLVVWDFDGGNRREVGAVAEGYLVVAPENNKWLYFVEVEGERYLLRREKL